MSASECWGRVDRHLQYCNINSWWGKLIRGTQYISLACAHAQTHTMLKSLSVAKQSVTEHHCPHFQLFMIPYGLGVSVLLHRATILNLHHDREKTNGQLNASSEWTQWRHQDVHPKSTAIRLLSIYKHAERREARVNEDCRHLNESAVSVQPEIPKTHDGSGGTKHLNMAYFPTPTG